MSQTRRDLHQDNGGDGGVARRLRTACTRGASLKRHRHRPQMRLPLEIANEALDAARRAGASYADARIGRYRRQVISTRERQVAGVTDQRVVRPRRPDARRRLAGASPRPAR